MRDGDLDFSVKRLGDCHLSSPQGGTILGTSRGGQSPAEMVDTLVALNIGVLFAIGGDGTLRGAQAIADEAARRGLRISVIGVPKTIDNDVSFVQCSHDRLCVRHDR